ncbi:hypothetical protein GWN42_01265, partial [candidate division KSB1 bacterium]|nr:hypothetical protein [candidate division KSB1 bacterium]
ESRRDESNEIHQSTVQLQSRLDKVRIRLDERKSFGAAMENLTGTIFARGNSAQLLTTGKKTFDELFAAIDEARSYI